MSASHRLSIPASLVVVALWVTACGGPSDFTARFTDACVVEAEMPPPVCDCLASRAETEITTDGRALLLAILEGDDARAEELRGTIPVAEAMQAGMFMAGTSACTGRAEASD